MTGKPSTDAPSEGSTPVNEAYAAVARQLRENGYSPIPLCDKKPSIVGWPAIFCERLPTLEEIEQEWSWAHRGQLSLNGVGVATADGLIIIDVDDDAAVERVLSIVPQAREAPSCVGQRGRKIFLRVVDGRNLRERNISGVSTGGVVELLAWHRQAVIPPTMHPKTGRPYVWTDALLTLLTVPLQGLPTISDNDIDALRRAFMPAIGAPIIRETPTLKTERALTTVVVRPGAAVDGLPDRWWAKGSKSAEIERLIRLFGIVHRAARDRGGQITLQMEGTDAAGHPHRAETIDINATGHWRHVVRIIVDELGNTPEAYRLHVEVSRGNPALGLPGGPETFDEVGNRRFFDSVTDARTFASKSGKRARTLRTLLWWVRMVEGRPPGRNHVRKQGRIATFHQMLKRTKAAGVDSSVAAARAQAALVFRSGSKKRSIIDEALDAIASNQGNAWLSDLAGVAARHGVAVRSVQRSLAEAERAGVLVRIRGNEGGKRILLTVHASVEDPDNNIDESGKESPSLLRHVCEVGEGSWTHNAEATQGRVILEDDDWPGWDEETLGPPPFGIVRRALEGQDQQAFDEFLHEARKGRCTEETLLLAGILPQEASAILLQIVEQNRAGKTAGSRWLRHIAGEIGELALREPEQWPHLLQEALDYVADRIQRTAGRPTPTKWARILAQNLGFVHERAGRFTPMARAAQAARRRWEKARSVDVNAEVAQPTADPKT